MGNSYFCFFYNNKELNHVPRSQEKLKLKTEIGFSKLPLYPKKALKMNINLHVEDIEDESSFINLYSEENYKSIRSTRRKDFTTNIMA